jgi:hypothetical protein
LQKPRSHCLLEPEGDVVFLCLAALDARQCDGRLAVDFQDTTVLHYRPVVVLSIKFQIPGKTQTRLQRVRAASQQRLQLTEGSIRLSVAFEQSAKFEHPVSFGGL